MTTNDESLIAMYAPAAAAKHLSVLTSMIERIRVTDDMIEALPDHVDGEPYSPAEDEAFDANFDAVFELAYFVAKHKKQIRFSAASQDWE